MKSHSRSLIFVNNGSVKKHCTESRSKTPSAEQTLLSLELWKQHFWIQYIQRRRIQLSQVRLDLIAFKHLPVVAFRRCPNLRDLLVLAKLPSNSTNPNPQLPCGSFRCGKNCATCPYLLDGLTSYTFFSTGETRTIKSNLACDTKNLIYMIQCNRCNLQYIEETKRRLKDRFNEHRRTIDNPKTKSKPTTAAEHFLSSPNHTTNDMQLIPIEKIFSNRDSIRVRPKKLCFNFKRQNTCTSWPQHSRRNILII